MAEQQRIHPVDVEAPLPSAPPAPPSLAALEKSDSTGERPTIQVAPSRPPKKKRRSFCCCCCRCLCCTLLAIVLLVLVVSATTGVLYVVFDPKIPKYSVDRLRVSDFSVRSDMIVDATFDVTVTARNPNKEIGIYYRDGSDLSAWYAGERLCTGSFPAFYQGHRNTTVVHVLLTGETRMGSELLAELLQQQQQTGKIPLTVRGDVPVSVRVGKMKLWKMTFQIRCDLVVNSLSTSDDISVRSNSCQFKLKR
ncbi:NDR1/HIN1-like protein 6 [Musa acuminata AAA Group]|uniref:NDR1/HIN1-like protein 6 n=1 Tax=Musa acuminata AAA Group TaxID=214697 RepID=UPI0031D84286